MPLPSAIKLFIDPKLGLAFGNFAGSSQITNPTFTVGDTAGFEIYLVESTQVASYPRQELSFPVSPGIKVAIGAIDETPLAGTWVISYGGNSTSALAYNVTAAQLQTALNALASITSAGGVTVSKIGDNYNIAFNLPGVRTEITTDGSALVPLSQATVATLQAGTLTKPQISLVHLQRTVAGLATSFTQTSASQINVDALAAWDGSAATYRVSISPDPKGGSFTLSFDAQTGTDVSTASILVGASGQDVFNALNINALAGKVSVSQVGAYAYDITVNVQPGTNGMTANDAGVLSFNGYVGNLSLNTAEAISLLDGADSVETTLEVEITSDSKTLTLLQIPCTLQNAVIDAGAVEPLVLDTYLSQNVADGRYLRQSNNLSDLGSASTARTNLDVYSTSQVDTALALKADDSDLLLKADLSGASFTGDVTLTGRMGIGGGLANNPAHKLAIYNGNIVFSSGFGLAFGDGSVQTTAFTGAATVSWGSIQGTLANQTDLASALSGKASSTHTHIIGDVTGLQTALDGKQAAGSYAAASHTHIIGDVTGLQTALDGKQAAGSYAAASHTHIIGDVTGLQTALDGKASTSHTQAISTVTGLQTALDAKAALAGATFTGKVNLPDLGTNNPSFNIGGTALSTTATSAVSGDVWISGTNPKLTYKVGTSNLYCATSNLTNTFTSPQIIDTTSSTAALRITQKGAGNVVEIEDSTNPDATAFIIDQSGFVGIGTAPSGGVYKVQVAGSLTVTTSTVELSALKFYGTSTVLTGIQTTINNINGNFSDTDYPLEMYFTIAGTNYAVPCRQV